MCACGVCVCVLSGWRQDRFAEKEARLRDFYSFPATEDHARLAALNKDWAHPRPILRTVTRKQFFAAAFWALLGVAEACVLRLTDCYRWCYVRATALLFVLFCFPSATASQVDSTSNKNSRSNNNNNDDDSSSDNDQEQQQQQQPQQHQQQQQTTTNNDTDNDTNTK